MTRPLRPRASRERCRAGARSSCGPAALLRVQHVDLRGQRRRAEGEREPTALLVVVEAVEDAAGELALADEHALDRQAPRGLVEPGAVRPRAAVDVVEERVAIPVEVHEPLELAQTLVPDALDGDRLDLARPLEVEEADAACVVVRGSRRAGARYRSPRSGASAHRAAGTRGPRRARRAASRRGLAGHRRRRARRGPCRRPCSRPPGSPVNDRGSRPRRRRRRRSPRGSRPPRSRGARG